MIKIENEQLAKFLMFKLNKNENEFTEEELSKVDEIVLDTVDIEGNYNEINLDIIKCFSGAEELIFRNIFIEEKDLLNLIELSNLNSVYFEKCEFENEEIISKLNVSKIELINCDISDYSFLYSMENLESLSVLNGQVSLDKLNNLQNLKYLQISCSNISEINSLNLPNLEEIHIGNSNIEDLSILKNLNILKQLEIDENQYNNNKEIVNKLNAKGVAVFGENGITFGNGGVANA